MARRSGRAAARSASGDEAQERPDGAAGLSTSAAWLVERLHAIRHRVASEERNGTEGAEAPRAPVAQATARSAPARPVRQVPTTAAERRRRMARARAAAPPPRVAPASGAALWAVRGAALVLVVALLVALALIVSTLR